MLGFSSTPNRLQCIFEVCPVVLQIESEATKSRNAPEINDFIEELVDKHKVHADGFLAQRATVVLDEVCNTVQWNSKDGLAVSTTESRDYRECREMERVRHKTQTGD